MAPVKRAAALALLSLAGCSSFDGDFEEKALPRSEGLGSLSLVGRWEGTWTSDETGHTGGLRCIITGGGHGEYAARYHATYGWCIFQFAFEYTLPTTAIRQGSAWMLHGSAFLDSWIASGLYSYEARVEGDDYIASYRSSFDHGIFRMKRVR